MNRISALILDWAGTTVDFGSFAPTQIFVEAFRQAFDIEITLEEARVPMGLGKWQHIEALGKLPAVDSRWQAKFGRAMTAADIDAIYAAFMPLQIAKVVDFSAPIAGVVDTIAALRAKAKNGFEQREGAKLTFLPFFVKAATDTLKSHPKINASIDDKNVHYWDHEHIGIAVDAPKGLMVPVIKDILARPQTEQSSDNPR